MYIVHAANIQEPTGRVIRARAKALGVLGGLPPLHPVVKQDQEQALQPKTKRASSDNKSATDVGPAVQAKRRAVLKDISDNPFNRSRIKLSVPNWGNNGPMIVLNISMSSWKARQSITSVPTLLQGKERGIKNVHGANTQEPTGRVTRARAKALGVLGGNMTKSRLFSQKPNGHHQITSHVGPAVQAKRSAVLKDISNNPFNGSRIKLRDEVV
ncbi:Cyclin A/B/D/E [Artemisia annua]|uniref:Cyclin A/B/D/E n=1 Tax=Artemisia annua TaxID=35608 RepID=A0A2U1LPM5_ARTAN|nr:Cyclin A/B/D/E [Artemisia annua]